MKLRDNIPFEKLKQYGFIRYHDGSSYDYKTEQYTLFIWNRMNTSDYMYRKVYMELVEKTMILDNFDILEKLIIDHIIE